MKDIVFITVSVLIGFFVGRCSAERVDVDASRGSVAQEIVRVTVVDTVRYYKPEPVARMERVDFRAARLPLYIDTPEFGRDTATRTVDSVTVVVPIEQKEYRDSTYRAWVSGYMVNVDSLLVYPKTETIYIREARITKPKRWHIGATAGYGMTPQGLKPYAGIGITYSIISL